MTVTPKGIVTPEDNGPWNLITDLTIMGNTTDTAITNVEKGANLFKGTGAQRNAFTTAPEGTHWQDTDGTKSEWLRASGSWQSLSSVIGTASYQAPFSAYGGNVLQITRHGSIVNVQGIAAVNDSTNITGTKPIAMLPVWARPDSPMYGGMQQGSGDAIWMVKVDASGALAGERYRPAWASGTNIWLPFSITFRAAN